LGLLAASASTLGITVAMSATLRRWCADFGARDLIERAVQQVAEQDIATVGEAQQPRIEARQVLGDVLQVPAQDLARVVVPGHVDRLGHVDQGGSGRGHQHVVRRQIAMNAANSQQGFHLHEDLQVQLGRFVRGQVNIRHAGRGGALCIHDQLHK
jgi:hypothetical protein